MFAGWDEQRLFLLVQLGIVAVHIAIQRPLGRYLVGEARCQAPECIHVPGAGPGVAAIQDDGQVWIILRHFGQQDRQFLIRQIKTAGAAAVNTHQAFIFAIRIKLAKGFRRSPACPMAAVLKHRHIIRRGFAEVVAKLFNNIIARGVAIFEDFDGEVGLVKTAAQIGMEMIHIV